MRISDWSSDVCSSDLCAWANLATLKKSALRRVSSRSLLPVSVPARGMVTSSFEPDRSAGSKLSRVEKPGKVPVNTSTSYLVANASVRAEEHTAELQALMRNTDAVFCLKKKIETEDRDTKS